MIRSLPLTRFQSVPGAASSAMQIGNTRDSCRGSSGKIKMDPDTLAAGRPPELRMYPSMRPAVGSRISLSAESAFETVGRLRPKLKKVKYGLAASNVVRVTSLFALKARAAK
eukprot:gnl/TRDRNA2_/TRDRNA2_135845_c0_seq1.p1 gnl/TRDRNA2_/TRDRNA2_135845_c0~~gnl/TRDRNA2_/TRDRNA2_135845_c0_seq1.p1  ORF type:complete len:112 (+),score=5.20 gnl/TRDRNA2_/TRDRNA2_135845_c0_seq1:61-396(+)